MYKNEINFNDYSTLLELVEAFAEECNHTYCDEQTVSNEFDTYLEETNFFDTYGEDDDPAINEAFSCFTDDLYSDGKLHSEQVNKYCYVGKWG